MTKTMVVVEKDKVSQEASCLARFQRIVLTWDLFRLVDQRKKYEKGKVDTDEESWGFRPVKDSYTDVDDYISTYEPLIFEEIRAEIASKDGHLGPAKTTCLMNCSVDAAGFHLATVMVDIDDDEEEERVKPNDLLLLSKPQRSAEDTSFKKYAFALVESRRAGALGIRMYLAGKFRNLNTDTLEPCPRLSEVRALVTSMGEGDRLFDVRKVCSLSTTAREYIALQSIGSLPLKDIILSASEKNFDGEGKAWKLSKPLEDYIKQNLNESQQKAIQAGLSRKPFVLIQGPPGTGKTQTILALLSAILHATPARAQSRGALLDRKHERKLSTQEKFNHWRLASPWLSGSNPREKTMPVNGDDGFFPTTGNELKPEVVSSTRKYRVRVLVCAPSNSALDEIVLRVTNNGVRDESDRSYNPKIVRIGLRAHHSIQAVSMKELVQRKKGSIGGARERDGGDDSLRAVIMEEAVIVFSTLSFSGSANFSKWNRGFDVVIIDEAAQAVEPATLVPFVSECKQIYLIGDPVQLPATVKSPVAVKYGYGRSMFERFQRAGYPVTMLKMQYRMHPEIRSFPSGEFYADSLEDGPNIKEQTKRSWHEYNCFGPFYFFDLHEAKEVKPEGGSWVNFDEVEFVFLLYHNLVRRYPDLKSSQQFAIISPYRAQVELMKERFKNTFGVDSEKVVDITTVDGCQGREKDVAIFSCVRGSEKGSIGFLEDFRRMNVGITRAKSSILVVGSASTLRKDIHWNNLVENAEKRECFVKVSKPYTTFFSDDNLESMRTKEEVSPINEVPNDDLHAPFEVPDDAPGDENADGNEDDMDMNMDDD